MLLPGKVLKLQNVKRNKLPYVPIQAHYYRATPIGHWHSFDGC